MTGRVKYSPTWDLSTIPPELILSEASRIMRERKKHFRGGRKIQPTRNRELSEKRRKKREAVAKWRAKQKGETK